jgi:hypothetical protein
MRIVCKGRSVWTEIKDFVEFDLRGKFRGGEYIIKVTTIEGVTFDNRDFFMNKSNISPLWKFSGLQLDLSNQDDFLTDSIQVSSSIVSASSDSHEDYQHKMIHRISKNDEVIIALQQAFRVINKMLPNEARVLIGHGILGFSYKSMTADGQLTERYMQRLYVQSLKNFAMGLGLFVD